MRRSIALVLILALMSSLFSFLSFAEETEEINLLPPEGADLSYNEVSGDNVAVSYEDGNVIFAGEKKTDMDSWPSVEYEYSSFRVNIYDYDLEFDFTVTGEGFARGTFGFYFNGDYTAYYSIGNTAVKPALGMEEQSNDFLSGDYSLRVSLTDLVGSYDYDWRRFWSDAVVNDEYLEFSKLIVFACGGGTVTIRKLALVPTNAERESNSYQSRYQNIAKNASYEVHDWYRMGGAEVGWSYDENAVISYPDESGTSLIDGFFASSNDFRDEAWIGLSQSHPNTIGTVKAPYIDFRLNEVSDVGTIRVSVSNLNDSGISAPAAISAQISEDGENYTGFWLGTYYSKNSWQSCIYEIQLNERTQFIRLNFHTPMAASTASETDSTYWLAAFADGRTDTWAFIDEVEIYNDYKSVSPVFVSHIQADGFEGAGTVWYDYDNGFGCSHHAAFEPVSNSQHVYRLVEFVSGADGNAHSISIPENGFVLTVDEGNNWPELMKDKTGDGSSGAWYDDEEHLHMPNYASENAQSLWNLLPTLEVGQVYTVYGVNRDWREVPTFTPGKDYYDPDYQTGAFIAEGNWALPWMNGTGEILPGPGPDPRMEYEDEIRRKLGDEIEGCKTNIGLDAYTDGELIVARVNFWSVNWQSEVSEVHFKLRYDADRLAFVNSEIQPRYGMPCEITVLESGEENGEGYLDVRVAFTPGQTLPDPPFVRVWFRLHDWLDYDMRYGGIWVCNGDAEETDAEGTFPMSAGMTIADQWCLEEPDPVREYYENEIRSKLGDELEGCKTFVGFDVYRDGDLYVAHVNFWGVNWQSEVSEVHFKLRYDANRLELVEHDILPCNGMSCEITAPESGEENGEGYLDVRVAIAPDQTLPDPPCVRIWFRMHKWLDDNMQYGGIWVCNGDAEETDAEGTFPMRAEMTILDKSIWSEEPNPKNDYNCSCDQVISSFGNDLANFGSNNREGTYLGDITDKTGAYFRAWGWIVHNAFHISRVGYRVGEEITWDENGFSEREDVERVFGGAFEIKGINLRIPVGYGRDIETWVVLELENGEIIDFWRIVYTNYSEYGAVVYEQQIRAIAGETVDSPLFQLDAEAYYDGTLSHVHYRFHSFEEGAPMEIRIPVYWDSSLWLEGWTSDWTRNGQNSTLTCEVNNDDYLGTKSIVLSVHPSDEGMTWQSTDVIELDLTFEYGNKGMIGATWTCGGDVVSTSGGTDRFGSPYYAILRQVKILLGDLDGNSKRDAKDYLFLKRTVMKTWDLDAQGRYNADIDQDGNLNANDYLLLKRLVLGTYSIPTEGFSFHPDGDGYCLDGYERIGKKEIVVPDTYRGRPVVSIGAGTFQRDDDVEVVVLPDSIECIYSQAFFRCTRLREIHFGNGLKSIATFWDDDYGTFERCNSLETLQFPDSLEEIGERAFRACGSLRTVTMGSGLLELGSLAFENCTSLESIELPDALESIGYGVFQGCRSLNSADLGSGITTVSSFLFRDCASLESVTFGEFVDSINTGAFENCEQLAYVSLPSSVSRIGENAFLNTAWVGDESLYTDGCLYSGGCLVKALESISGTCEILPGTHYIAVGAFEWCGMLTSVVVPDSVTSIGWKTFANCASLSSVTLPDTLRVIEREAFVECPQLSSLQIPSSVVSIGEHFIDARYLSEVSVEEGNENYKVKGNCLIGKTSDSWRPAVSVLLGFGKFAIPEDENIGRIGSFAFDDNTYVKNLDVPGSVREVGECAFRGCRVLRSISFADFPEEIERHAFEGCESLHTVSFPKNPNPEPEEQPWDGWSDDPYNPEKGVYYVGEESYVHDYSRVVAWGGVNPVLLTETYCNCIWTNILARMDPGFEPRVG